MFILNLLKEGKINADEAVNLLNALAATETNGFDEFARGVKVKAADFAEKAEPKMKKAAYDIRSKSAEVFDSIKEKIKERKVQDEPNEIIEGEYVEIVSDDTQDETEE